MEIKHFSDLNECIAGDGTRLREYLHPAKGNYSIGYSLARACLPPGKNSLPHRLKNSEVYYIIAGEGIISVNGQQAYVQAGSVVYIPPGAMQSIHTLSKKPIDFLCLVDPPWRPEDEEILHNDKETPVQPAMKKERVLQDTSQLEDILQQGRICTLAFPAEPAPYLVQVCYGFREGKLYFHSSPQGNTARLARYGGKVSFHVSTDVAILEGKTPCAWSVNYRMVTGTGTLRLLEKRAEKKEGLSVLMKQYISDNVPLSFDNLDKVAVVEIKVETLKGKKSLIS